MPKDITSQKKPEKIKFDMDHEGMKDALGEELLNAVMYSAIRACVEEIENEHGQTSNSP